MKYNINYLTLLFILLSCTSSFSQDLVKGLYHVGFKHYKIHDESRLYVLDSDTISRPLLIHFWYPSIENLNDKSCSFKNYIDLISLREDYIKAASEVDENSINFINAYAGFAKHNLGVDTNLTTQEILDHPVLAKYGAQIEKSTKKFPLIIYAPSNSKSAVQNHIICEYLASHGYMVISVGSAGVNSLNRKNDQESIMAQVYDMEYILAFFEDNLNVKYARLGLMSFSSGGLATAIFQMRNKKVKAVFSMDGSQEYGSYLALSKAEDFDLKKTKAPYCLLVNNYENFSIYPFYNSIVTKKKQMFRMHYLDHNGFVSYWRFFDLCSPENSVSKTCISFDYISSAALTFFDLYLKTKSLTNSKPVLDFQTNEYIESIASDNSTIAQLGNLIISSGIDPAIDALYANQEVYINKVSEINILSKMFRDSYPDVAIRLLLFNMRCHPNSWQTLFELGFTYKLNGDLTTAKEYLLKAQELYPDNTEIIKLLNEVNASENL